MRMNIGTCGSVAKAKQNAQQNAPMFTTGAVTATVIDSAAASTDRTKHVLVMVLVFPDHIIGIEYCGINANTAFGEWFHSIQRSIHKLWPLYCRYCRGTAGTAVLPVPLVPPTFIFIINLVVRLHPTLR
eukprot:SAG31_NODE_5127_length_2725_cov_1.449353_1_plen_129_part_00